MWRLVLAVLLFGGLVVVGAAPAAALDYEPPVVPPDLLLGGPPATAPPAAAGDDAAIRLRLARPPGEPPEAEAMSLQGSGVAWTRAGAPGPLRYIPRDQFQGGDGGGLGGCALWNWNTC
jgi:hypothetical protein